MKILIVSARVPYPLDTGAKIRAYHLLKALSKAFEVTLLTYYGSAEELEAVEHCKTLGVKVVPVLNPLINKRLSGAALAKSVFTEYPYTVEKYNHADFRARFASEMSSGYDVVHCEHLHMAHYLDTAGAYRKVLDAHNVESEIARRLAVMENNVLKKAVLRWHYNKTLCYETESLKKFDLVMAVSDKDRKVLAEMSGNENVRTVENGVDMGYFSPGAEAESGNLVFVGSMDWKPNDDGMLFFVHEILPLIHKKKPDVKLFIVGRKPSPEVMRLSGTSDRIVVTGSVDDVRPYVRDASVYVVPLRIGGGTRLKVLEAFAMKKAVVSTSLGSEGIAYSDGESICIADAPQVFADAVLGLLADRERRRMLGNNAFEIAKAKYSWETIGTKAVSFYEELQK